MDRNSIIGFVLLLLLGGGYIFYSNHEAEQYKAERAKIVADSLAQVQKLAPAAPTPSVDSTVALLADSTIVAEDTAYNVFKGKAETITMGNSILTLGVSTKGGAPISAQLDSFKTYIGHKDLYIFNGDVNKLSFAIPFDGKTVATSDLFFVPTQEQLPDGTQQLKMTAELGNGKFVVFEYALAPNSYMIKSNFKLLGFQSELAGLQNLPLQWVTRALRTEQDLKNERLAFQDHYLFTDKEHDYFTVERTPKEELTKPVKWFAVKTHFFNSTLIADQQFTSGSFDAVVNTEDTTCIGTNTTTLQVPVVASNDYNFGFSWLISDNSHELLKSYNLDLDEMIPYGFGIFSFVKYICKWFIIPIFDFLTLYITDMGVIIILMTLIIRLLLSFFSYKSYLSQAKMRVLKPQLDKLKEKFGGDQQQMGMEQMKLYKTAGVNPLGGCLPMLLQMPFLLAMYYFIPTAIQLRQAKFLWSDDLSTYDSIWNFGFNIPLYGDHVSLFTLLMTATSLWLALYNRNNTAGAGGEMANNAALKYMPYIMPIMFLGWFNNMAAGLTFYYAFSNLISILQQFVIQKFMINEDKILQQLEANKLKPKNQTSKWQERLEAMQKMQAEKNKK